MDIEIINSEGSANPKNFVQPLIIHLFINYTENYIWCMQYSNITNNTNRNKINLNKTIVEIISDLSYISIPFAFY